MTGASPIVTQNAINFTPDNLRCYAYSGNVTINNTSKTLLSFQTNSEYIKATIQFYGDFADMASNKKIIEQIEFNGIQIVDKTRLNNAAQVLVDLDPIYLIIPPFTEVSVIYTTDMASDLDYGVTLIGEVYGMTETGYQ